jgi:hypothetical protein
MIIAASFVLAGCAAKKYVMVEQPKGIALEYKMTEGEPLRYKSSDHSTQTMEPMGMPMETKTTKSYEFTIQPEGRQEDTYQLEITIDAMDAGMSMAQGDFSADVAPVIGKSFGLSMSVLGEVLDLSEAESIQYGIGPQGTQSIAPDFQFLFPRMPEVPVDIGDSWTVRDTVTINQGGVDIAISSEGVNTVAAFEPMGGFECAKIVTEITGTVSGEGEQQGAQVSFEGTLSGTETWYFAYEEGLFVENSVDMFSKGTINVSGPSEMSFPMTERTSSQVVLVK